MAKLCHMSRAVRYSLRITFAVIGVLLGVSAGFVFFFSYSNAHAAVWALISAVFAALTLCLHVHKYRDIEGTSLSLAAHNILLAVGIVGIFSGMAALIAYITKGVSAHEHGVDVTGFFIVTVWAWMTLKWGAMLFLYTRVYKRLRHAQPKALIG